MSDLKAKSDFSTDATTSISTSSTSSPNKPFKSSRKGRGAKQRQTDRYRTTKNERFDQDQKAKIEVIKQQGATGIDYFGSERLVALASPEIEIVVSTSKIIPLVIESIRVLYSACKVPPPIDAANYNAGMEYDYLTLLMVVEKQIKAKFFFARLNSNFSDSAVEMPDHKIAADLFDDSLLPLSFFIEQIGRVKVGDQMFIPRPGAKSAETWRNDMDFIRQYLPTYNQVPPGAVATNVSDWSTGRRIFALVINQALCLERGITTADGNFTPAFLENPGFFNVAMAVESHLAGVALPDVHELANRYNRLLGRIRRRLVGAVVPLNIKQGNGCCSQLVACRTVSDRDGYVEVYSARDVPHSDFVTSACLELGAESLPQVFPSRTKESSVSTAGAITKLANSLTLKIVR